MSEFLKSRKRITDSHSEAALDNDQQQELTGIMDDQLAEITNTFGSDYPKGHDIASLVLRAAKAGNLDMIEPPIFSTGNDNGEVAGFNTALGVAPHMPLSDTTTALEKVHNLGGVRLESVTSESQLTEREMGFMAGRLPAVRLQFT